MCNCSHYSLTSQNVAFELFVWQDTSHIAVQHHFVVQLLKRIRAVLDFGRLVYRKPVANVVAVR